VNPFNVSVPRLRVDSTFVRLIQVVDDVKKSGAFKSASETTLSVGGNKSSKPVVRDTNRGDDLTFATVFKTSFSKDRKLSNDVVRSCVNVREREDVAVVEEYLLHVTNDAFVHSNLVVAISYNFDVVDILKPSRVVSKVSSFVVLVLFVVGRNDDDGVSKFSELKSKLVDHDSKTTDS